MKFLVKETIELSKIVEADDESQAILYFDEHDANTELKKIKVTIIKDNATK